MTINQSCYIGYSKFSNRVNKWPKLLPNLKMHYLEEIKSNNLDIKKDRPIVLSHYLKLSYSRTRCILHSALLSMSGIQVHLIPITLSIIFLRNEDKLTHQKLEYPIKNMFFCSYDITTNQIPHFKFSMCNLESLGLVRRLARACLYFLKRFCKSCV